MQTIDIELFWRTIDAYSEPAPDGPLSYGMMYIGLGLVSSLLEVRFICNSKGVEVDIFANYDSREKHKKYNAILKNETIVARKMFTWEGFCYDEFLAWIGSNGSWEDAVKSIRGDKNVD